jgi:hypothetical protein
MSIGATDHVQVEGVDTRSESGVGYADFGVGWTQDVTNPVEVFVDNIVVDTAPVPCT